MKFADFYSVLNENFIVCLNLALTWTKEKYESVALVNDLDIMS